MSEGLSFSSTRFPKILLLGNGILRLYDGGNWDDLLKQIGPKTAKGKDLTNIPYAMQPEALCGVDVETVQRQTAVAIHEADIKKKSILQRILELPFDAILTTNYAYEIESVLIDGKWTGYKKKKAFTTLDGHSHVRHNTSIYNMVHCKDGRDIPVFHIHGERLRKHSLVLSYYSYANAVSRLIELNKQRGNDYQEKQIASEEIVAKSWLDYFLMGEVYAVGFGFDPSEFDIWWAIERKARERANHGTLHALMTEENMDKKPQKILFEAMKVDLHNFVPVYKDYDQAYEDILKFLSGIVK